MTSRRILALVMLLAIALVGGCARVVSGHGRPLTTGAAGPSFPSQSGTPTPSGSASGSATPTGSATATPTPTAPAPTATRPAVLSCPTISDTLAGIRFSCLTPTMKSMPVSSFSANVVLQTETTPAWYLSQSSLPIKAGDAATLATAVNDELDDFVGDSYPPGSTGEAGVEKATVIGGKPAYLITGLVTVAKTDPDYAALKANQDRIEAVAILRGDGTAAMLIMAVPDTQKNLWPKMDVIATSARLI